VPLVNRDGRFTYANHPDAAEAIALSDVPGPDEWALDLI
jgi:hypothetical protein